MIKGVLQLLTVRADVLHGARTHAPRDQRHVLHTAPALRDGMHYQIVPDHTGSRSQRHLVIVLRDHIQAGNAVVQHYTGPVAREEHVTAAAQHQPFQPLQFRMLQQGP